MTKQAAIRSRGGIAKTEKILLNRFAHQTDEAIPIVIKPNYLPLLEQIGIPPQEKAKYLADLSVIVQTVIDNFIPPLDTSERTN